MQLIFENQGISTFLVYTVEETAAVDSMSLGMLTNNKIPGFAAASFTQMDATKYIKYNVSSKVSAAQLFSGPVNKKRLIGVFKGVVEAMLSAEEYMIDPATILLDMDYIFTDVSTCETVLICLPVIQEETKPVDLGAFFKNIIFSTQFDQTENCAHVAQIINYLNSSPLIALGDFKEVLEKLSDSAVQPVAAPKPVAPAPQPVMQQPVAPAPKPVVQQPAASAPQPVMQQPVAPAPKPMAQQPVTPVPQPVVQRPMVSVPQNAVPAKPAAEPVEVEEEMTLMYLMQHYNKENAAKYKAQQDAKKAAGTAQKPEKPGKPPKAPKVEKPAKPAKAEKPAKAPKQAVPSPFAVPGQKTQNPAAFAVPGQKAQNPAAFAVPGQKAQSPAAFAVPGQKAEPAVVAAPAKPQPVVQAPVKPQPAPQPVVQQPVFTAPVMPAQQPMNFGETTILGGGAQGETTVLGAAAVAEQQITPYLVRAKNNERILLNKPVFRIGKEKSYVDYFIGDNTAVSRSHANIVSRNGEYFVVDTNSTNHTYVNGGMIQSNVETKLSHGTKIRLANEDFEFKLY